MREIKFRGIVKGHNVWVYGSGFTDFLNVLPDEKDKIYIWSNYQWIQIEKESFGQYTGLKDCNGKEIYEGDIVRMEPYPDIRVYPVVYENGGFGFLDKTFGFVPYSGHSYIEEVLQRTTIIGNIHENKELL